MYILILLLLFTSNLSADIYFPKVDKSGNSKVIRIHPCRHLKDLGPFAKPEPLVYPRDFNYIAAGGRTTLECLDSKTYAERDNSSFVHEAIYESCDYGANSNYDFVFKNCVNLQDEALNELKRDLAASQTSNTINTTSIIGGLSPAPSSGSFMPDIRRYKYKLPTPGSPLPLVETFVPLFTSQKSMCTLEHKVLPAALKVAEVGLLFTGFGLVAAGTEAFIIARVGGQLAYEATTLSFKVCASGLLFFGGSAALELPPKLALAVKNEVDRAVLNKRIKKAKKEGKDVNLIIPIKEGLSYNDRKMQVFLPYILAGAEDVNVMEESMGISADEVKREIISSIKSTYLNRIQQNISSDDSYFCKMPGGFPFRLVTQDVKEYGL